MGVSSFILRMCSQSLGCRWGFSDKPDRRPGVGRTLTGSTLLSGKHPTPDVPISGRGPRDEAPGLCLSGTREDGPTPVANPVAGPGPAFLPSRGSRCPLCSFPSAACPNLSIPHAPPQWELAQLHGAVSLQDRLARTLSYTLQSGGYFSLHLSYSLPYLSIDFKHRWSLGVRLTKPP